MNMFDTFSNEECKAEKDENSKTSLQKIITPKNTEDEYAEAIFDWWISKKSYKQWYAEKYLQLKINFNK